jgi:hypothetical protein
MIQIKITEFKNLLGEHFFLVEQIWQFVSSQPECSVCGMPLGPKEIPVGLCSDFQKLLVLCLMHTTDYNHQVRIAKILLEDIWRTTDVPYGTKVEIRGDFLIVPLGM